MAAKFDALTFLGVFEESNDIAVCFTAQSPEIILHRHQQPEGRGASFIMTICSTKSQQRSIILLYGNYITQDVSQSPFTRCVPIILILNNQERIIKTPEDETYRPSQ
jgi:hypothetical protein